MPKLSEAYEGQKSIVVTCEMHSKGMFRSQGIQLFAFACSSVVGAHSPTWVRVKRHWRPVPHPGDTCRGGGQNLCCFRGEQSKCNFLFYPTTNHIFENFRGGIAHLTPLVRGLLETVVSSSVCCQRALKCYSKRKRGDEVSQGVSDLTCHEVKLTHQLAIMSSLKLLVSKCNPRNWMAATSSLNCHRAEKNNVYSSV